MINYLIHDLINDLVIIVLSDRPCRLTASTAGGVVRTWVGVTDRSVGMTGVSEVSVDRCVTYGGMVTVVNAVFVRITLCFFCNSIGLIS